MVHSDTLWADVTTRPLEFDSAHSIGSYRRYMFYPATRWADVTTRTLSEPKIPGSWDKEIKSHDTTKDVDFEWQISSILTTDLTRLAAVNNSTKHVQMYSDTGQLIERRTISTISCVIKEDHHSNDESFHITPQQEDKFRGSGNNCTSFFPQHSACSRLSVGEITLPMVAKPLYRWHQFQAKSQNESTINKLAKEGMEVTRKDTNKKNIQ